MAWRAAGKTSLLDKGACIGSFFYFGGKIRSSLRFQEVREGGYASASHRQTDAMVQALREVTSDVAASRIRSA